MPRGRDSRRAWSHLRRPERRRSRHRRSNPAGLRRRSRRGFGQGRCRRRRDPSWGVGAVDADRILRLQGGWECLRLHSYILTKSVKWSRRRAGVLADVLGLEKGQQTWVSCTYRTALRYAIASDSSSHSRSSSLGTVESPKAYRWPVLGSVSGCW